MNRSNRFISSLFWINVRHARESRSAIRRSHLFGDLLPVEEEEEEEEERFRLGIVFLCNRLHGHRTFTGRREMARITAHSVTFTRASLSPQSQYRLISGEICAQHGAFIRVLQKRRKWKSRKFTCGEAAYRNKPQPRELVRKRSRYYQRCVVILLRSRAKEISVGSQLRGNRTKTR